MDDSPREGLGPHRTKGRQSFSKIKLANLPADIAASLSALDIDGDGNLDPDELQNYHADAQRTLSRVRRSQRVLLGSTDADAPRPQSKYYRKLLMVLSVVFLAHLGASTGVLVGVVNFAKESHGEFPGCPALRRLQMRCAAACARRHAAHPLTRSRHVLRFSVPQSARARR